MKPRDQGFVLVAALWLLAALASLASAYAVYAIETAPGAALPEERLRAEAAIRAGVELCAFRQLAFAPVSRPDAGAFSTSVGTARIDVVYRAETARLDLNAAPREALAGLFAQLGAPDAAALADRVVGWRAPLPPAERERENAAYAKAGLAYRPPGAPFDNVRELGWLPGVTPSVLARALPYLTVFGAAKIDPFVAEPTVLAALPGATPALIKGFLAARAAPRPDAAGFARLAGPMQAALAAEPGDTLRAEIVVSLAGRRIRAEVVLKILDGAPAPYDILAWRDDFDGG